MRWPNKEIAAQQWDALAEQGKSLYGSWRVNSIDGAPLKERRARREIRAGIVSFRFMIF
jgi:hypothetical protein